jgi:hypothetical protein
MCVGLQVGKSESHLWPVVVCLTLDQGGRHQVLVVLPAGHGDQELGRCMPVNLVCQVSTRWGNDWPTTTQEAVICLKNLLTLLLDSCAAPGSLVHAFIQMNACTCLGRPCAVNWGGTTPVCLTAGNVCRVPYACTLTADRTEWRWGAQLCEWGRAVPLSLSRAVGHCGELWDCSALG